LTHKEAACGSWANYFNHQAEAQGIATLALRGFYMLKQKNPPATNFDNEEKWWGVFTNDGGVNNEHPSTNLAGNIVNSGKYAQSSTLTGATAWADQSHSPDPYYLWAVNEHAVVMLQKGTTTYLYDTSFEVGPVELAEFSIPDNNQEVSYGTSHVFRTQYIDNAGHPFDYVYGLIMFSGYQGGNEVIGAYVPVGDESLSPGLPTDLKFKWKDCESAN
jgi:hypothetical protein